VDAFGAADEQFGGPAQTEFLDLLGAKCEIPTSDTQSRCGTIARTSSILSGHSWIVQWFQSSGNP